MSLHDELPYRAEYAKSGRASCKMCKTNIGNGTLRLAIMVQSPFFDGKQPNWHHYECFFKRCRPKTPADFAHFGELKFDDQKRIEHSINQVMGLELPDEAIGKGKKKRKINEKVAKEMKEKIKYNDFMVDYAKSGGSKCRLCEDKVKKNEIRIGKMDYESETALRYGPVPRWFHVTCFDNARKELEFFGSIDTIKGFDTLENDDQNMLKKKIKKIEDPNGGDGPSPPKKTKADVSQEKALKKQSDLFYKHIENVKALIKGDMKELFEYNNLNIPASVSSREEALAECLTFGKPDNCPECPNGQLRFRGAGYICTGMATEWAKCEYQTVKPKRLPFKVPKDLKEKYQFLKDYKYVERERIYAKVIEKAIAEKESAASSSASQSFEKLKEKIKAEDNGTAQLVLSGYKFNCVGKIKYNRREVKEKIEKHGGKVITNVDRSVLCVISNKVEIVKKSNPNILEAEKLGVMVVSEGFLDDLDNGLTPVDAISKNLLSSWSGDVCKIFNNLNVKEKMKVAMKSGLTSNPSKSLVKSGPSVQKMIIKDGNAVDPDSELDSVAHILKDKKDVYNAILNKVDLSSNKNSYYKIQLLEHDTKKNKFYIFRSWGRIGTTIGNTKVENFADKNEAIEHFKSIYFDHTANVWEERKNFVKHPHSYYPVDVDYGNDEVFEKLKPGESKSKLPKSVQELITMIFDVQKMKQAMVEFELDMEKMPLGKLSKQQLLNACSVLKELSEHIDSKVINRTKLVDASNRFYTLIPHNFGLDKVKLIDNLDLIKEKMEMIETLLEIETAFDLLKSVESGQGIDPIDQYYQKLNAAIEPLDKNAEEYKLIEKYVKNTHGTTHSSYKLQIMDVFNVERANERKMFEKFKSYENRMLLWHGSRATNFAGILSQGLRIAPPEAPVTGYMFGKGIYFADMVSKSANYCHDHINNNIGLLLLTEVALGTTYDLTSAKAVTKPPKNTHSVKGCGSTHPDPKKVHKTSDGMIIPYGKGIPSNVKNSSLLYNEYIVYNESQVNIKYLLKLKFQHNF